MITQSEAHIFRENVIFSCILPPKSEKSVLHAAVTQKAVIWWFGSTVTYVQTPKYELFSSLHVRDMISQSEADISRANVIF